jgi:hypothetical protein
MRKPLICASILGSLMATQAMATAPAAEPAKAPIALTGAQMDKVVGGRPELQSPGTSDNSCNSGKCFYENNDHVIGKPVRGFNN